MLLQRIRRSGVDLNRADRNSLPMVIRILLVPLLCLAAFANAADPPPRPNILLAIGDNWAWPHAGALGDPTVKTPTFDRIAREGLLFNYAFCPVPSCAGSRSCLVTGRPAHQLKGAASLAGDFHKFDAFTELLEEADYEVGYTGKGWGPGLHLEFGWKQNPAGRKYKSFEEFMEKRDPAKPFFFWHGNTSVAQGKWKYDPAVWGDMDPDTVAVPAYLPDIREVRETITAYYAGVQQQDTIFGEAVALLEKEKLLDETLVIYTSDNGWQMPHGLANCYDAGTRIPLAMRWGDKWKNGSETDAFVSLTDFGPTFLDLAGADIPKEMTGVSFADVMSGIEPSVNRDYVFLERERHANVREGNLGYPMRSIRTPDFLYIWNMRPDRWPAGDPDAWYSVGDFGDVDNSWAKEHIVEHRGDPGIRPYFDLNFGKRPEVELYDLKNDPDQVVNVAGDANYEATRDQLRARIEKWMEDTDDPRVDPAYDEWDNYPYHVGPTGFDKDGNSNSRRDMWAHRINLEE